MSDYSLKNKQFIIENFDTKKPFYSFLPGVSGLYGIPMWSFYCNRGQGITSFGVKDKYSPIMEFCPASIAARRVDTQGFRTFVKKDDKCTEIFATVENREGIERVMKVMPASFSVSEKNEKAGLFTTVTYTALVNENICGLIRKVEIENKGESGNFEICDGLPIFLPYGLTNSDYQNAGHLLRGWTETKYIDNSILFTKQRASTDDGSEVTLFDQGNYYLSLTEDGVKKPVCDLNLVFENDLSLKVPFGFIKDGAFLCEKEPTTANKFACGFTIYKKHLNKGEKTIIYTLIGNAQSSEILLSNKDKFLKKVYFEDKICESEELIANMTKDVKTKTAYSTFDGYVENSYMDNFLRGGYPLLLETTNKDKSFVYYVYSRKHGDMERDYNWFTIEPEFFSQGNGNYRDVNQNRRNDTRLHPFVKDYNIKLFYSLVRADGYNPHNVIGGSFEIVNKAKIAEITDKYAYGNKKVYKLLSQKFTPGSVINFCYRENCKLAVSCGEFLKIVLGCSKQNIEATFNEGYWIDHWTYNLDLIEDYQTVYPDKMDELLFKDCTYRYYFSPVYVLPRDKKYVLTKDGKVRQYGCIDFYNEDSVLKKSSADPKSTNWLKDKNSDIVEVNLASKLFFMSLIKFATLDPDGLGIEMEGDRVGWNDAMNGLSALFGSGMSETIELKRLLGFIDEKFAQNNYKNIVLLKEQYELMKNVISLLKSEKDNFTYWDKVSNERENYRSKIAFGSCDGEKIELSCSDVKEAIQLMKEKINDSIKRAKELGDGIYPTYFYYEAKQYHVIKDENGCEKTRANGQKYVKVTEFERKQLPYFLEAPARSMKTEKEDDCRELYNKVIKTDLYDKALGLYKTCEDLSGQPYEVGRIMQFTPGHLERESCFLHMTYKYVLGLLKAGLYEEYFKELKKNLVAFYNPSLYARSTLENSSFIATSNNPDKSLVGQGFFARLTGANAELLNMWLIMMFGKSPFTYENKNLVCRFNPILASDYFDENGEVRAMFSGHTEVVYKNPLKLDTYNDNCITEKIILTDRDGKTTDIIGGDIVGEYAEKLRNGYFSKAEVYFIKK